MMSDTQTLESLFGSIEPDGYLRIYRVTEGGGRRYLCRVVPDRVGDVYDWVRHKYGGGRFQAEATAGDGHISDAAPLTFDIEGRPRIPEALEEETPEARELRRAEEMERKVLALQEQALDERFAALRADLSRLLEGVRNPPAAAEAGNPMMMALELVRTMRAELTPHVETPVAGSPQLLDAIRLGMEMGMRAGGTETDANPYLAVLDRFGDPLVRFFDRWSGAENTTTSPAATEETAPVTIRDAFARYVPTLVGWADRGLDPTLRAEIVAEELPDEWAQRLGSWFDREARALDVLSSWFPDVADRRGWFGPFVLAIAELLQDAPEEIASDQQTMVPQQRERVSVETVPGSGSSAGE